MRPKTRIPRFCVTEQVKGLVFVVHPRSPDELHPAELVDFSRFGAGVRVACAWTLGEQATLRIVDRAADFSVSLPGEVRWCRPVQADCWSFGCSFYKPLSFEICGEFFLRGYLTADDPRPADARASRR